MEMMQLSVAIQGSQRGMIMPPPAGRRLSVLRLKRLVSSPHVSSCSSSRGPSSSPRSIFSSPAGATAAASSAAAPDSAPSPAALPVAGRSSPWLLVGRGNPGTKYEGTRHNVGFEMIDTVARTEGISLATIQFKSLLGRGRIGDAPVLLAKPQTFMNLSGSAVRSLASYYKIPPERVLTIYDDLDLVRRHEAAAERRAWGAQWDEKHHRSAGNSEFCSSEDRHREASGNYGSTSVHATKV